MRSASKAWARQELSPRLQPSSTRSWTRYLPSASSISTCHLRPKKSGARSKRAIGVDRRLIMYSADVDYYRATSVADAVKVLQKNKDAKVLAGGHSLIPAMKLRVAQPALLV